MVAIFNGLQRPKKGRSELDLPIGTASQVRAQHERDREIGALEKENDDVSEPERRERIAALRRGPKTYPWVTTSTSPIRKRLRPIC